jgi:hypothetical protein
VDQNRLTGMTSAISPTMARFSARVSGVCDIFRRAKASDGSVGAARR